MKRYVKSGTKFHKFGFGDYKSETGYVIEIVHGGGYGNWCKIYAPDGTLVESGVPGVATAKKRVEELENGEG